MEHERSIQLNLSETQLRVLIREEQSAALDAYEEIRSRNDKFAHLPRYLTKKTLSEMFGVSVNTISNWTREQILPSIKFNRAVRYDREEIIKIILEGKVQKYHTR